MAFDPAPMISLGDKIVTDINAATWTPSGGSALTFTAQRVYYLTEYPPTDTALRVDVQAAEIGDEVLINRTPTTEKSFDVAIRVQKHLTDRTSKSEIDALVNFVYALRNLYALRTKITTTGSQGMYLTARTTPVIYSPEEIDKNGRFYSDFRLTFKGMFA